MTVAMLDFLKSWLPMVIAALALIISGYFNWSGMTQSRTGARHAREKDLHDWARKVGDVYVALRTSEDKERREAVARLSILVDYGRLFFPNERTARALQEHEKGRRSSVLDPLVETCVRCSSGQVIAENKVAQDWREFTDQLGYRTTAFAIDTSPEAEGHKQYRNR